MADIRAKLNKLQQTITHLSSDWDIERTPALKLIILGMLRKAVKLLDNC
jgi:hypothetical protein